MAQKKNTGKRTSTAKKEGKKSDKVKAEKNTADSGVLREIWALALIATGIFLFAAVQFHIAGAAGNLLGDFLKGIFGLMGYVFPWYLILCGVLLFLKKEEFINVKGIILTSVIIIMLCILNSGRFIDDQMAFEPLAFYNQGIDLEGGGIIGMVMGLGLVKAIGKIGLYIFSVLIIVACILLLVNTPISQGLSKMKEKNEEIADRRKERREEKAEEETQLKFENSDNSESPAPFKHEKKYEPPMERSRKREKKKKMFDLMKDENLFTDEKPSVEASEKKKEDVHISYGLEESPSRSEDEKTFGLEERVVINTGYGLGPSEPVVAPEPETRLVKASEAETIEHMEPQKLSKQEAASVTLSKEEIAQSEKVTVMYRKPSIELLNKPKRINQGSINSDLKEKAALLEETLKSFNVDARVVQVTQGPAVTRYEIQPNVGVKVSSIVRLSDDIALNLRAKSIRIEAPIPGKAAVGIEVENDRINMVTLREIIDSDEFKNADSKITFAVGKDIAGKAIVADLKGMPHLLIAGSTGSGKSVCINSIITSILYKANPDEVKLVLIDPKVVELGNYNGIPHLLIPVVTEPVKAAAALNWAVAEMTDRYKKFADAQVRDLESYNETMRANHDDDLVMPQIVIIIDELADLMMAAPSQVEESICRLAQMARAAGMHLIVATQRPSVDIITGVIKANIPSRIAFAVSSQFDSRTILDMSGAEKLVGKGDMLFNPLGMGKPVRVQGTFVSDSEVHSVIEHVKSQVQEVEYAGDVMNTIEKGNAPERDEDDGDELLSDAIECVVRAGQASVSMLQRRFRIGYNRAARIVDMMEARGIVGPQDGSRPRQVLLSEEEFDEMKKEVEE